MIIFDPGGGEPERWLVCFSRQCATLPWLPIGEYKHVRAFGCVAHINTWVFFDPRLQGTVIKVARGDFANALIREFLYDAAVIAMPAATKPAGFPLFGWCVPAVAHLLGLHSSALRPIELFRQCLRQGGILLSDGHTVAAASAAARSADRASGTAGAKPAY